MNKKPTTTKDNKEEVFDVKITNGAGKLLRQLMDHFGFDKSKDIIALSLQLLDKDKDSEITIKRKDGSIIRLDISSDHDKN